MYALMNQCCHIVVTTETVDEATLRWSRVLDLRPSGYYQNLWSFRYRLQNISPTDRDERSHHDRTSHLTGVKG